MNPEAPSMGEPTDHLTIKIEVPTRFRKTPQTYAAVAERMAVSEARRAAEWLLVDLGAMPSPEDQKPLVVPPVPVVAYVPQQGQPEYEECLSCQ